MRELIVPVQHKGAVGLQTQLRRHLVDAILDGRLSADESLPSCRRMAQALGVSRNTVVLAYQALTDEGFLISRERVGYFVNVDLVDAPEKAGLKAVEVQAEPQMVNWWPRLRFRPSENRQIVKQKNWQRYPYPFIYGQADPSLFPTAAWRTCSRQALGLDSIRNWAEDSFGDDDPSLIEEVRTHVLPRRGIKANPNEILITMGAQNALFMIAQLLSRQRFTLGVENPGYVDVRNIFSMCGAKLKPLPVDGEGLLIDEALAGCDGVYVTPSHQSPTTVTLPLERRTALLEAAGQHDFFVIEDDYEAETNFISSPTTALKSMDRTGNVIYISSFSKHLAPGLRIGFLVGSADLIQELRELRRLLMRHPPTNNQRTMAFFIGGGYYDALIQRLQRVYRDRWHAMGEALARYLPDSAGTPSFGGTSFWVRGPEDLDSDVLLVRALGAGIVIEPGSAFFMAAKPPRNYFRLGFSLIPSERIAPGNWPN